MIDADLHPLLRRRSSRLDQARKALTGAVGTVQAACKHRIVAEMPYQSGGFNARRICLRCRLEEEGSHWSGGKTWSKHDHSEPPTLGNQPDRIVTEVDRDAFYALRIRP